MMFFRENILGMQAYIPGEQPLADQKMIKLNSNELPYPPSPNALAALKNIDEDSLRRYPDPLAAEARRAAAEVYDLPEDWILAGNGSDELMSLIARACLEPGRKLAYPVPTYSLYKLLADVQLAEIVEVPFLDEPMLPVKQLINTNASLTFISSPNNPTGHSTPLEDLELIANSVNGLLIIDEAYADFAPQNALQLVKNNKNVIILRTLSKGYALAGLRFGFAIANPEILKILIKIKDSYNVDAISIRIASAAIRDQKYKNALVEKVIRSREILSTNLKILNFKIWPSQANFLLVRPPNGDASSLYRYLKQQGILIRFYKQRYLEDKLRISIGTDAQNQILIQEIKRWLFE